METTRTSPPSVENDQFLNRHEAVADINADKEDSHIDVGDESISSTQSDGGPVAEGAMSHTISSSDSSNNDDETHEPIDHFVVLAADTYNNNRKKDDEIAIACHFQNENDANFDPTQHGPMVLIRGPALLALSMTGLLLPFLLALSIQTMLSICLFCIGSILTMHDYPLWIHHNVFLPKVHKFGAFLQTLTIDNALESFVGACQEQIMAIASTASLYSLPLSSEQRMNVVDAFFPPAEFTLGEDRASLRQVLASPGGALHLLPTNWRMAVLGQQATISSDSDLNNLEEDGNVVASRGGVLLEDLVYDNNEDDGNEVQVGNHLAESEVAQTTTTTATTTTAQAISRIVSQFSMQHVNPILSSVNDHSLRRTAILSSAALLVQLRTSRKARSIVYNALHGLTMFTTTGVLLSTTFLLATKTKLLSTQRNDNQDENVTTIPDPTPPCHENAISTHTMPNTNDAVSDSLQHPAMLFKPIDNSMTSHIFKWMYSVQNHLRDRRHPRLKMSRRLRGVIMMMLLFYLNHYRTRRKKSLLF